MNKIDHIPNKLYLIIEHELFNFLKPFLSVALKDYHFV